ncbi:MAG TPA: RNA methyltransferase [Planctomycetota bacterium]|jgi:tRNA G18 (ribose-2'-O)-methylase SpoU|nr:RNA methyltransferase [Planctomycetota bacterium]
MEERAWVQSASAEDLELFSSLRGRRHPEGMFIGDGDKVVRRMLERTKVERILCTEDWVERLPIPPGIDVRIAPKSDLFAIVGFRLHQGLMALGVVPPEKPLSGTFHVALDGLANAENVGAILRTCAAFGVEGVLLGPGTASPWLRRAVRVSLGAPLVVPVHSSRDLAASVSSLNAYAAHIHGDKRDYRSIDYREPVCLVLGSEPLGVTEAVLRASKGVIYIPMATEWDCLNVAASAAVLLSEVRRQRRR